MTGTVFSLAVSGSTVYAGGGFSSVGGQPRKNIVAVDIATGNATAWDPTAGSTVYSLALSGSTMYVGGGFTFIGGQSRNRIAALDIATGNATPWNPGADNTVYTLAVGGSVLYAGGNFGNLGGQSRLYLGAIDAATGSTLSWNPAIGLSGGPTVRALALSGSTIYVAGQFLNIAGQPHANLAGISDVVGVGELSSPSNDRLSLLSHPNPGVGATQLQFTLDREAEITLLVYDITGREVARLADRRRFGPGPHEIRFEGRGLPSGVYLCLLRAGEATTVRRIVFMP